MVMEALRHPAARRSARAASCACLRRRVVRVSHHTWTGATPRSDSSSKGLGGDNNTASPGAASRRTAGDTNYTASPGAASRRSVRHTSPLRTVGGGDSASDYSGKTGRRRLPRGDGVPRADKRRGHHHHHHRSGHGRRRSGRSAAARRDRAIEALRRPGEARSEDDLRRLRGLVLKFRTSRDALRNVPTVILDQLLRCASLISLEDGHALFTAGQHVGWVFILLAGSATVFVDEDNLHRAGMGASSAESGGVERYLAWHAPGTARAKFTFPRDAALGPLFPGDILGGALFSAGPEPGPRGVMSWPHTVVAEGNAPRCAEFLAISHADVVTYFASRGAAADILLPRFTMLSCMHCFEGWSAPELLRLALHMRTRVLRAGQAIALVPRDGAAASLARGELDLYFVASGSVAVQTAGPSGAAAGAAAGPGAAADPASDAAAGGGGAAVRGPGAPVVARGVVLGLASPFEVLGEFALLPTPAAVDAAAPPPGTLLVAVSPHAELMVLPAAAAREVLYVEAAARQRGGGGGGGRVGGGSSGDRRAGAGALGATPARPSPLARRVSHERGGGRPGPGPALAGTSSPADPRRPPDGTGSVPAAAAAAAAATVTAVPTHIVHTLATLEEVAASRSAFCNTQLAVAASSGVRVRVTRSILTDCGNPCALCGRHSHVTADPSCARRPHAVAAFAGMVSELESRGLQLGAAALHALAADAAAATPVPAQAAATPGKVTAATAVDPTAALRSEALRRKPLRGTRVVTAAERAMASADAALGRAFRRGSAASSMVREVPARGPVPTAAAAAASMGSAVPGGPAVDVTPFNDMLEPIAAVTARRHSIESRAAAAAAAAIARDRPAGLAAAVAMTPRRRAPAFVPDVSPVGGSLVPHAPATRRRGTVHGGMFVGLPSLGELLAPNTAAAAAAGPGASSAGGSQRGATGVTIADVAAAAVEAAHALNAEASEKPEPGRRPSVALRDTARRRSLHFASVVEALTAVKEAEGGPVGGAESLLGAALLGVGLASQRPAGQLHQLGGTDAEWRKSERSLLSLGSGGSTATGSGPGAAPLHGYGATPSSAAASPSAYEQLKLLQFGLLERPRRASAVSIRAAAAADVAAAAAAAAAGASGGAGAAAAAPGGAGAVFSPQPPPGAATAGRARTRPTQAVGGRSSSGRAAAAHSIAQQPADRAAGHGSGSGSGSSGATSSDDSTGSDNDAKDDDDDDDEMSPAARARRISAMSARLDTALGGAGATKLSAAGAAVPARGVVARRRAPGPPTAATAAAASLSARGGGGRGR